jgi:hypothetical protein
MASRKLKSDCAYGKSPQDKDVSHGLLTPRHGSTTTTRHSGSVPGADTAGLAHMLVASQWTLPDVLPRIALKVKTSHPVNPTYSQFNQIQPETLTLNLQTDSQFTLETNFAGGSDSPPTGHDPVS